MKMSTCFCSTSFTWALYCQKSMLAGAPATDALDEAGADAAVVALPVVLVAARVLAAALEVVATALAVLLVADVVAAVVVATVVLVVVAGTAVGAGTDVAACVVVATLADAVAAAPVPPQAARRGRARLPEQILSSARRVTERLAALGSVDNVHPHFLLVLPGQWSR